jgi:hypothetical protein
MKCEIYDVYWPKGLRYNRIKINYFFFNYNPQNIVFSLILCWHDKTNI